ncbi:MAG: hypothetical protein KKA67_06885 [Spirochaetes bacterium]|nr:hypothetical protein [Spirochaetota bacterium]MBU1081932.1 hypothetical protein [Spirochaetota bacterium]
METVTLGMAISDAAPPLLYLAASFFTVRFMRLMGERELSGMFMAGSLLAFLSGAFKVSAKIGDALARRPVTEAGFLYDQMFPMMAVGFLATAAAVVLGARRFSGRDRRGERTRFAETASWVSPFAAGVFLGLAFALVMAVNGPAPGLKAHFLELKRYSMLAMVLLQLSTMGILAWFSFRERATAAGVLSIASIAAMLLMGMLASPSTQARFENRILMNWIDQAVNMTAQAAFLGAAIIVWDRVRKGAVEGVGKERRVA